MAPVGLNRFIPSSIGIRCRLFMRKLGSLSSATADTSPDRFLVVNTAFRKESHRFSYYLRHPHYPPAGRAKGVSFLVEPARANSRPSINLIRRIDRLLSINETDRKNTRHPSRNSREKFLFIF